MCAFTGHRPERLPWGNDESQLACLELKIAISQALERVYSMGYREFACGMARGCDLYFAEAVMARQLTDPTVSLDAFLPCPEQADRWEETQRSRYYALLRKCRRVYLAEDGYQKGCMLKRNRMMLDKADLLISVFDGQGGGTGWAVGYANAIGVPVLPIWR